MKRQLFLMMVLLIFTAFTSCRQEKTAETETNFKNLIESVEIVKIEMYLSAIGVESDDFPSVNAVIDFSKGTSFCEKSYFNPAYKGSTYTLSKSEMKEIKDLLKMKELVKLKPEYKIDCTDAPSSNTIFYTKRFKYKIYDYGLSGQYPLQDLYRIVYKIKR